MSEPIKMKATDAPMSTNGDYKMITLMPPAVECAGERVIRIRID
tara:strand:- start:499 stop:630 length:132 start_codon:yes stop_codon:yes gene_type:complete